MPPKPLREVCDTLRPLTSILCEVCGAPTGDEVFHCGIVGCFTRCATHDPSAHADDPETLQREEAAQAQWRVDADTVALGEHSVLACGLQWRDFVQTDTASLAPRLRQLAAYESGPAAALVTWVRAAALQHAHPGAIQTLNQFDLQPLLKCHADPVRMLALRLVEYVSPVQTASSPTAVDDSNPGV